jgi:hypothetical protein
MTTPLTAPLSLGFGQVSEAALRIARGVRRLLADQGFRSLLEFPLANGRRADILALNDAGQIVIIEVKSCAADFRADRKWADYLDFCDRFYFAVDDAFPQELIPDEIGLMVADGFGAAVMREGPVSALNGARRRAVILRTALLAAGRLHRAEDPAAGLGL